MSSFSTAGGAILLILTLFASAIFTLFSVRYFLNKFIEDDRNLIFYAKMTLIFIGSLGLSLIVSFVILSFLFVGR